MRILITVLAILISAVVTAAVAFYAVIFLAGPHGGVLPSAFQSPALAMGWLAVIGVPVFIGRWTWRRFGQAHK